MKRAQALVAESVLLVELVEQSTRCQFRIGDIALAIEPMRPYGGAHPDQSEEAGVERTPASGDDEGPAAGAAGPN
ncbi:hypothetical protein GCM10027168_70010 [Streptomyces capparidis]